MWIVRYGSILKKPRDCICGKSEVLKDLLHCSLCLGFWCGVLSSTFLYIYVEENPILILLPLASSAVCWFFDSLLDLIQISCNYLDKNN